MLRNPIIVALDGKSYDESVALASKLAGKVGAVKLNDLFFQYGMDVVEYIIQFGCPVMLDGKFHDIPNTITNTLRRFKHLGGEDEIRIVTVHASGGTAMIQAAVKEMPGKIAAVTVLTSLDERTCEQVFNAVPEHQVFSLAVMAEKAGVSYVVCSGQELDSLRLLHTSVKRIVPGIRPEWYPSKGDQKRTMTPREAVDLGADYLVMGRAITMADDPVAAVERTLGEIGWCGRWD